MSPGGKKGKTGAMTSSRMSVLASGRCKSSMILPLGCSNALREKEGSLFESKGGKNEK
jgi:hypothetical protein